jgi:hypothetical protein
MAIINGRGRVGARPSSGGGTPTSSYLLDTYSGAVGAYSLRKLSSTSTYAIRVRRSSDNTEMNIGFDGSGNLDTTALTTFVGAGNGFVVTWYDQSGNANNTTQSNATFQPQIVSSGTILTKNGKPTVSFNGNSNLVGNQKIINNTAVSIFSVFSVNSLTNRAAVWDIGTATGYNHFTLDVNTWSTSGQKFGFYACNSSFDSSLSTNLNQNLVSIIANTAVGNNIILNTKYSINSTLGTLTGSASDTYRDFSSVSKFSIGSFDTLGIPLAGQIQEIVFYPTNKTTTQTSIDSNINTYYSIYPSDSDAAAFVSAAGITNSTQMSAVNTLVTSLKSSGVWNKMKAIYPVVGGNATAHSKNLKNPSQYNLTFSSGWSHTTNGMTPNGSAYASTSLIPRSALSTNSTHISYYSRTNKLGSNECEMGTNQVQNEKNLYMCYDAYNTNYIGVNQYGDSTGTRLPNTLGMLLLSRNNSTQFNKFFNNSKEVITHHNSTTTHPLAGTATFQMTLGCIRDGDVINRLYSTKECAFSTIGDGLTDSEASAFYTAVQAFQTTLGRQV